MVPSPVRRAVLRTGKTCLKVLRTLATVRRPRGSHVAPATTPAAKVANPLDGIADLEDLQNRLNEAAERKSAELAR